MNPYDKAHELGRELAASPEYHAMLAAKKAVAADAVASRMMNDFDRKQRAAYLLIQQGGNPSMEQMQELQTLAEIIQQNSILGDYLQADARLGQLLGDVQRIIHDAVQGVRWEDTQMDSLAEAAEDESSEDLQPE